MDLAFRIALCSLSLAALIACKSATKVDWTYRDLPPETATIVAAIYDGDCSEQTTYYRSEGPVTNGLETPEPLGAGAYCIVLEARSADCKVIATASQQIQLPRTRPLELVFEKKIVPLPLCTLEQVCVAGKCETKNMDAGTDGAADADLDAALDADANPDAASDASDVGMDASGVACVGDGVRCYESARGGTCDDRCASEGKMCLAVVSWANDCMGAGSCSPEQQGYNVDSNSCLTNTNQKCDGNGYSSISLCCACQ